jgi:signal transduction histidine kinase
MHERLPVTGGDELVGLATVINALLDRLESTFERQRRFIADASHELRTPTAVVRTEADITLARATRPEGEYRESVTVMRDAAQRLTRIVDDLFLLTRADAGHLVARQEPVDLEAFVHAAARAVQPVAHARGVEVVLDAVVDAPVCGDADLLGRLFLNLLDNAVKYGPVGGRVTATMTRTGTQCRVQVEDAGPGIPLDAQDRVFERFVRLDTARSRSESSTSSGAGLGLAIARRIAEVHGGTLAIASSQPGRTVFAVQLPVTMEDTERVTGRSRAGGMS